MKKTGIVISIILGITFLSASLILGISLYKTKGPVKTISVVGLAEKDFVSDLIVWNLSTVILDQNLQAAYTKIKEQNTIVKDYLLNKGIPENEIVFNAVDTREDYQYDWDSRANRSIQVFRGYELTQTIRIESQDVEKIEIIAREVSELLDKGIQIYASRPEYYYTKLADLKIEMLANAARDARNRAETIAGNAGARLKGVKTANMGVFQITAPNSAGEEYTWGGTFNTSSKNKRASINMRLTYFVK